MKKPRPAWPQRFIRLAREWSQYSTCLRAQVGAVLFDPKSKAVLSIGYNDTPIDFPDCGDGGCKPCQGGESVSRNLECMCVHAESNCLAFAARRGTSTEGAHIATAGHKLCNGCRKLLIQAGVVKVLGEDFTETLGA